jgi:hypothetical protein
LKTSNKVKVTALLLSALIIAGNSGLGTDKEDKLENMKSYNVLADTNTTSNNNNNDTAVTADVNTSVAGKVNTTAAGAKEDRPKFIENPNGVIDGHKLIAQNDKREMYFKEDTLSIIMREKNTGAVMYSTVAEPDASSNEDWRNFVQSGVVMEYLQGTNIVVYRADLIKNKPKKTVTVKDNGFSAKVEFTTLQISYELNVTLTDDGFTAEIPNDKIIESGDKFKVAGFYVYPFLGYTKLGERQGYMLIPDGSGALINLEDNKGKFKQPFSGMIYGSNIGIDDPYVLSLYNGMKLIKDPEKILAPVFGMVHTDSKYGYLGIVEEGDFSSRIEAYPSGAVTPYNWISSKFIYRQFYNQPTSKNSGTMVVRQKERNNFNIKISYKFVSEEAANYTGLAHKYRGFITENGIVNKKNNDFKVRVDFLGADKENGLFFKKAVPMTTTENISEVINTLQSDGTKDILSIYKGWQKGGIYGGLPSDGYSVEKSIGGAKGLNTLLTEMKDKGINFYLAEDALRTNPEESRTYDIVRKFNKRDYEEEVYGKVYRTLNYLMPEKSKEVMKDSEESFKENNVENIMLSGISNILFSYADDDTEMDRVSTKTAYESIVSDYDKSFNLALEQPFAYLWKYTNAIIDMPVESSSYVFTDQDVPFFAIALKGIIPMYSNYTNFQANQKEFFLKLVEQGVYPSFLNTYEDPSELINTNSSNIYSSKFDRYRETINTYYNELKAVNDKIKDAAIVSHTRGNGLTKVEYSNGITIYVNYNEDSVTDGGITVEARSYKVDDAK